MATYLSLRMFGGQQRFSITPLMAVVESKASRFGIARRYLPWPLGKVGGGGLKGHSAASKWNYLDRIPNRPM